MKHFEILSDLVTSKCNKILGKEEPADMIREGLSDRDFSADEL